MSQNQKLSLFGVKKRAQILQTNRKSFDSVKVFQLGSKLDS